MDTNGSESSMAAGVLQDRMLEGRMPSMADQTDVEMAKVDLGLMMSIE